MRALELAQILGQPCELQVQGSGEPAGASTEEAEAVAAADDSGDDGSDLVE
jgi:hypothetical protein